MGLNTIVLVYEIYPTGVGYVGAVLNNGIVRITVRFYLEHNLSYVRIYDVGGAHIGYNFVDNNLESSLVEMPKGVDREKCIQRIKKIAQKIHQVYLKNMLVK